MKNLLPKSIFATGGVLAVSALGLLATQQEAPLTPPAPVEAPSAAPAEAPAPSFAASTNDDEIVFYGHVDQSERADWGSQRHDTRRYGVFKFTLDGGNPVEAGGIMENHCTGGGLYYDGNYYLVNGTSSTLTGVTNNWIVYDTDTWKVISRSQHKTPTLTDPMCMTYDYVGGKAYAVGMNWNNADNPYELRTINLETGEMTNVGRLGKRFPAIACDAQGQLWGIAKGDTYYASNVLYKIDKNTAQATMIGELGVTQKSIQASAVYDYRNNKLYWTARTFTANEYKEETYTTSVYEINLSTGKATEVKNFPEAEIFGSLYINGAHPMAPEGAQGVKFAYDKGSYNKGKVEFTFPTHYYNRTAIPAGKKLTCEIYLEGQKISDDNATFTPGQKYTSPATVTLADSAQNLHVYIKSQDLPGERSTMRKVKTYGKPDVPMRPASVTATYSPHHDVVTLNWEAPEGCINGGAYNPETIKYKVVRVCDAKVIADGITERTCVDVTDIPQTYTQYRVYAINEAGQGGYNFSTAAIIGQPYDLPFVETFDKATPFYNFTIIDTNNTATEYGDTWYWWELYRNAVYYRDSAGSYNRPADSWLVTPAMKFREGYVYRVSFVGATYYDQNSFNFNLQLATGELPTAESLKNVIYEGAVSKDEYTHEYSILFTAPKDTYHVGFHITCNGGYDHFSIDNLRIQEYGQKDIPAAPEFVSIRKEDGKAYATVKLPTKTVGGDNVGKITQVNMYTADRKRLAGRTEVKDGMTEVTVVDEAPLFGMNDYEISAVNEHGSGMEVACSINMRADKPQNLSYMAVRTASDGRDAVIEWAYPENMLGLNGETLTEDDLTFEVYRLDNYNPVLVATLDGDKTSLTLPDVIAGSTKRQDFVTYYVRAVTTGGESEMAEGRALFGAAYELPVLEDFTGQYTPWDSSRNTRCSFSSSSNVGYDPRCEATQGQVLSFIPSSDGSTTGLYISPRINFTSLKNPTLSFSMYCSPDANVTNANVQIGILQEVDGLEQEIKMLPGQYKVSSDEAGWKTIEVDLKKYGDITRGSIVLRCYNDKRKGRIHFDTISITGERPEIDARVKSITGPYTAIFGRQNTYYVNVDNNGVKDLENVKVSFFVDGEEVESKTVDLNSEEELTLEFAYAPELDAEEGRARLSATATVEGDSNHYNDAVEYYINTEAPDLPYVNDLGIEATDDGRLHLFWSEAETYPHDKTVHEDFESYKNFTVDNFGGWTMYDLDKEITSGGLSSSVGNFTWDHCGEPQAYIIWNPEYVGVGNILTTAHSGERCLLCMPSANKNNDWLISPALSGRKQTLTFYTKALLGSQFTETYSIMISRSGTDIEDFTPLRENVKLTSQMWMRVRVELPAGTRYFAIVCQSENGFGLLLDDFEYVPAQAEIEFTGFNVYRDRELLAEGVGETEHYDADIDRDKEYTYHVTATYTDGESILSNPVKATWSGVEAAPVDKDAVVYAHAGAIHVKVAAGTPVAVYSLDGRCLYSFISNGAESLRVGAGIYVVRAGDSTAKLIVK